MEPKEREKKNQQTRWFGLLKCFRVYFIAPVNFTVSLVGEQRNLPALVPARAFLGISG